MLLIACPTSWLVTGANRGIGFELVKQLLDSPNNLVIATCRNLDKATALSDLKNTTKGTLHIIQLDVTDFANVRASVKEVEAILGDIGLDYLVNNAAIVAWDSVFDMDPEKLVDILRTNTVGPALISQVYLPLLEKGRAKKILHISSTGGSFAEFEGLIAEEHRKLGAYALSKAALNMLAYKQKVARPDLIVIALCPGWVKTDMGGEKGLLQPEESIAGIIKVITNATSADSGKFLRYNGEEIPW
ncbi:hypothetical protein VTO73DRAFT_10392 [Trametes versicolor]